MGVLIQWNNTSGSHQVMFGSHELSPDQCKSLRLYGGRHPGFTNDRDGGHKHWGLISKDQREPIKQGQLRTEHPSKHPLVTGSSCL